MRQFTRDYGTAEISAYVACAAVTAVMLQVDYRAGHPPWFFWVLAAVTLLGVIRIFRIAWREDRGRK